MFYSDGTTVRYFVCNDNYGLYVRAGQIESIVSDTQTNLSRSASNQSIKSQSTPTGTAPSPTNTGIPTKPKQTGLRAPAANTAIRPPGIRPFEQDKIKRKRRIVFSNSRIENIDFLLS